MAPKFSCLIDKAERFLSILDRREITADSEALPTGENQASCRRRGMMTTPMMVGIVRCANTP